MMKKKDIFFFTPLQKSERVIYYVNKLRKHLKFTDSSRGVAQSG